MWGSYLLVFSSTVMAGCFLCRFNQDGLGEPEALVDVGEFHVTNERHCATLPRSGNFVHFDLRTLSTTLKNHRKPDDTTTLSHEESHCKDDNGVMPSIQIPSTAQTAAPEMAHKLRGDAVLDLQNNEDTEMQDTRPLDLNHLAMAAAAVSAFREEAVPSPRSPSPSPSPSHQVAAVEPADNEDIEMQDCQDLESNSHAMAAAAIPLFQEETKQYSIAALPASQISLAYEACLIAQSMNSARTMGSSTFATKGQGSSIFASHAPHFNKICAQKLDWSDNDMIAWIDKRTLPFLKHWKLTCYNDPALRKTFQVQLGDREALRGKIVDICHAQKVQLSSPRSFIQLAAGPSRHVARTAVIIHDLSIANAKGWADAFADNEDGGFEVVVELVLDVFVDLSRRGRKGYFHSLVDCPRIEISRHSKDGGLSHQHDDGGGVGEMPRKFTKARTSSRHTRNTTSQRKTNTQKPKSANSTKMSQKRNVRQCEQSKLKRLKRVKVLPADADLAARAATGGCFEGAGIATDYNQRGSR